MKSTTSFCDNADNYKLLMGISSSINGTPIHLKENKFKLFEGSEALIQNDQIDMYNLKENGETWSTVKN